MNLAARIELYLLQAGGFVPTREIEEAFSSIAGRIRQHGIAELRKIKHWKQARHNVLTGKRPDLREVHSGQLLLLPV